MNKLISPSELFDNLDLSRAKDALLKMNEKDRAEEIAFIKAWVKFHAGDEAVKSFERSIEMP